MPKGEMSTDVIIKKDRIKKLGCVAKADESFFCKKLSKNELANVV